MEKSYCDSNDPGSKDPERGCAFISTGGSVCNIRRRELGGGVAMSIIRWPSKSVRMFVLACKSIIGEQRL
jgi:hypothetical protein